ncbi:type 1 glutamine amidotransferase [Thiobacter aerophilum]|uniref:Type 1 glutamine amidotransferase n=1 Tax=Thiobacter aerophilum TaxID=3121275 RepID=A0ABV0EJI5_9BURK
MKPVAVFRHAPTEGPGYFASFLSARSIPMTLVAIDAGSPVPTDVSAFSGLVFMGGPMSVNDDLPWIAPVLALIRQAVARDVPVLGHCLGGQLMAKALGGSVGRNPVKEIGWGEVEVLDNPEARLWFGDAPRRFESFHWHGETFTIPEGATRILESPHCANQAYVLGPHLGMQCHVEMSREMVETWCAVGAEEIATAGGPAVQSPEEILADLDGRVARLNAVAERLYSRWIAGLAR